MKWLRKGLMGLLLALVFLLAFFAAVDNNAEVALRFHHYATEPRPVSWWLLCAFLLGAAFAGLLNLGTRARLRREARQASRLAEARAKDLDRLKASDSGRGAH